MLRFALLYYFYQTYSVCVNESVFEMLNIHILTYCDTFHCKQTMYVSRVNDKSDRGNASEIQGKKEFFIHII